MSIPQQGGGPIESRAQLAEFLASGCKPRDAWRIGTEHEKFGYRLSDLKPLPYEGACSVRAMLEGLRDQFGWRPVMEGDALIGLTKGGANVSLEPGGQLELSGAPLVSIHETCEEVNQHLAEVRSVAQEIGAGFIGLGAAPLWSRDEIPVMPKGRYAIMRAYMPKVGGHGLDMMFRTCTIQVNLDFASEPDMAKKLRVGVALQPIATALFASSPFTDGQPNGWRSWRARIWRDVDPARSGMLPFIFEDGFGFERYVDYALDVPMYFVYRDGRYIDASGQSFRDFLDGRLPALPGEKPTLSDWADHLTTIFPEARLKKYIEMRGADGGPWRRICALPAFWVGLLYDDAALDAAWDVAKRWTAEQRETLREQAARLGLRGEMGGRTVCSYARELVEIAAEGLKARAVAHSFDADEGHFLNALRDTLGRNETLADELLRRHATDWNGDLSLIYRDYAY
ncbi:MAG: glutamate--cysteine ligase [Rubrimonas sp.]|uniref:glutamate--cysteine ligase n=1 Tax=Rubrimonas sp. TaxID=2036015 RepID=UPI002FDEEA39